MTTLSFKVTPAEKGAVDEKLSFAVGLLVQPAQPYRAE
jgi:hypothetical protein